MTSPIRFSWITKMDSGIGPVKITPEPEGRKGRMVNPPILVLLRNVPVCPYGTRLQPFCNSLLHMSYHMSLLK